MMSLGRAFILLIFSDFYPVLADPSKILPCYAPSSAGTVQPTTVIYYTTLYDCLMSCINTATLCASVIWDNRQHNCYMFDQTARNNPGLLLNRYGTIYYERLPQAGPNCGGGAYVTIGPPIGNFTIGPVIPPIGGGLACPQKVNTAYFVAVASSLVSTGNSTTLTGLTEENDCLTACTDQINPTTKSSLGCSSISTQRNGTAVQCTFGTGISQPDGPAAIQKSPNSFLFQKFCLGPGAPSSCFEEFFYLFPQMTLDGHTISTQNNINSLVGCSNLCISTANCRAAVYDSGTSLCILKDSVGKGDPGFRASSANVYYVENGCLNKATVSSTSAPTGGRALSERLVEQRNIISKTEKQKRNKSNESDKIATSTSSDLGHFVGLDNESNLSSITRPPKTDNDEPISSSLAPRLPFVRPPAKAFKPINAVNIPVSTTSGPINDNSEETVDELPQLPKLHSFRIANADEPPASIPISDQLNDLAVLAPLTSRFLKQPHNDQMPDGFLSTDNTWSQWSMCNFVVGGQKSRVRTRSCLSLSQCLDKDIEYEICSAIT